jgi:hypothetical protein
MIRVPTLVQRGAGRRSVGQGILPTGEPQTAQCGRRVAVRVRERVRVRRQDPRCFVRLGERVLVSAFVHGGKALRCCSGRGAQGSAGLPAAAGRTGMRRVDCGFRVHASACPQAAFPPLAGPPAAERLDSERRSPPRLRQARPPARRGGTRHLRMPRPGCGDSGFQGQAGPPDVRLASPLQANPYGTDLCCGGRYVASRCGDWWLSWLPLAPWGTLGAFVAT